MAAFVVFPSLEACAKITLESLHAIDHLLMCVEMKIAMQYSSGWFLVLLFEITLCIYFSSLAGIQEAS